MLDGSYKGSGTAFKVALKCPGFEFETWTTRIINTFSTEAEAYEAEELLVPIEALRNPLCLNAQAGGKKGRNQNRSALLRRDKAEERREARLRVSARRKAKEQALKDKIRKLKNDSHKTTGTRRNPRRRGDV